MVFSQKHCFAELVGIYNGFLVNVSMSFKVSHRRVYLFLVSEVHVDREVHIEVVAVAKLHRQLFGSHL